MIRLARSSRTARALPNRAGAPCDTMWHAIARHRCGSRPIEEREVERTETLRFRTGPEASALGASLAPAIQTHREAATIDAAQDCPRLTEQCSDTGQDTYLSFELAAATSPQFWVVESIISETERSPTPVGAMFPGSCRSPWLHVHANVPRCVRIHALQANGTSTHTDTYCTGDEAAATGASGCSASGAGGGPSASVWLALTALLITTRRRATAGPRAV